METTKRMVRVISAKIFRSSLGDCSNGGLSSIYDEACIPCPDGWKEVPEDDPRLVTIREGYRGTYHATPTNGKRKDATGWMFGGCFIYSSDSRFHDKIPFYGALALHDRQEAER